jgi:signal transduction histidine kinase
MTARLLGEQALVVRAEKLASVGRLAAGIAHEIGNPLGAINGYTHIVRRRVAGSGLESELDGIERETTRIDRIVRNLLDYARPRRAALESVDVRECVASVVAMLQAQGTLKNVHVVTEFSSTSPTLPGERHELEQVLVNLLLNAADALRGEGRVTIAARTDSLRDLREGAASRKGDVAGMTQGRDGPSRYHAWLDRVRDASEVMTLTVADNGPGIAPDVAERIFDPFFTTKPPGKGTGLGLAIVARIVENHGGVVWARPSREGGAAIVIMLPVRPVGAVHAPERPPSRETALAS